MATRAQQPARGSNRIEMHEQLQEREASFEDVDFARRRDKRRRKNQVAKASRRKNRR